MEEDSKDKDLEVKVDENTIDRPSLFWFLTEGGRAAAELAISIPYRKLFADKDQGDGHPVLVLPGFLASDTSTSSLRKFIKGLGYVPYKWDLGMNIAKLEYLELLPEKLDKIFNKHEQKVSLIGWSLGGVFARQLAKQKPELVRQVITMGSPFKGINEPNNVAWLYNLLNNRKRIQEVAPELFADLPNPAPVPSTAIYTKEDGIVPWELCIEDEDEIHQNIQVRGSHWGLGVNPAVWEIIQDRLLYTEKAWHPFRPKSKLKDLFYYPSL